MKKQIQSFTLMMLINLFAFLGVGYILDEIFESGTRFKIIFLVLSVFSLVFLSKLLFEKKHIEEQKNETKSETKNDTLTTENVTK